MTTLDAAHDIMIEAGFKENYRRVLSPNIEYIAYYWVDKCDRRKTSYHNQMYTINGELTPKSLEFLERVAAKLNKKKHG